MTDHDDDYEAGATAEDGTEHVLDPADEIEMTPRRRPGPKSTLAVRLDASAIDELRRRAEAQGLGVTQLVRQWITERLESDGPPATTLSGTIHKVIAELNGVLDILS